MFKFFNSSNPSVDQKTALLLEIFSRKFLPFDELFNSIKINGKIDKKKHVELKITLSMLASQNLIEITNLDNIIGYMTTFKGLQMIAHTEFLNDTTDPNIILLKKEASDLLTQIDKELKEDVKPFEQILPTRGI